jgi:hypothetical protein
MAEAWCSGPATAIWMCDIMDMEGLRASGDQGVWLDVAAERGLEPAQQHALRVTDVSAISVLRKRVGRAAASMKVIGVFSAVFVCFDFPSAGSRAFAAVGVAVGVLVYWCARRLSRRLRAGDVAAAFLTAVWGLLWVADNLIVAKSYTDPHHEFTFSSALGMLIFSLPIYLIARGLIAFWRNGKPATDGMTEGRRLPSYPWESRGRRMEKHPAFVNKRSLSLYVLLFFVPLPYLFLQLSTGMADTPLATENTSKAELVSGQVTSAFIALLMWLPLTVSLYRRARRRALLPAAELGKKNPRPPVLYLRSFHDDKIKMRARAANGRSNLERVLKIRFEEVITDHLWRYGPVVAIGKPGEKLPPLGAARDYVSDEHWQQKVEQLMLAASLIVIVLGRTEGLAWELGKIIELRLVRKLVVLFPPTSVGELQLRWDALRVHAERAGLAVPHSIELQRTRAIVFPAPQRAHAIVSKKANDWTYETVLDAAAELVGPLTPTSLPQPPDRGSGQP